MNKQRKGTLCTKTFDDEWELTDYFNEHPEYELVSHSFTGDATDVNAVYYQYDSIVTVKHKHKNKK